MHSEESERADGILCWVESYADRLASGCYRVNRMISNIPVSVGISLFPTLGPNFSECVTRGVRVRASAIYVPEMSHLEGPQGYFFAYSFRFRLVEPPDAPGGMKSCQLLSRHFIFTKQTVSGEVLQDLVDGQAVVRSHVLPFNSITWGYAHDRITGCDDVICPPLAELYFVATRGSVGAHNR